MTKDLFDDFIDSGREKQEAADAVIGQQRKQRGQERVLSHQEEQWKRKALFALYQICRRMPELTADDFRWHADRLGVGDPYCSNAWSAVFAAGGKKGWMEHTGRSVISKRKAARGRRVPVWKSLLFR